MMESNKDTHFGAGGPSLDLVGLVRDARGTQEEMDRPLQISVAGRWYIRQGDRYDEIISPDPRPHASDIMVSGVSDFMTFANAASGGGIVCLGRTGCSSAETPYRVHVGEGRDRAKKSFFWEWGPGGGANAKLNYVGMVAWIDLIADGMENEELTMLRAAFRSMSAALGSVKTVTSEGAVIKFTGATERGVTASGVVPKVIHTTVPFGDPAFEAKTRWLLTVEAGEDGALFFTVRHDPSDGAFDAWLHWAEEQLADLPDGWIVIAQP